MITAMAVAFMLPFHLSAVIAQNLRKQYRHLDRVHKWVHPYVREQKRVTSRAFTRLLRMIELNPRVGRILRGFSYMKQLVQQ